MPMDLWLYEYAQRLFNARYEFFKTGKVAIPERPKFPKITCRSTRYILMCSDGPYAPLLFKWDRLEKKPAKGRPPNVQNQENHYNNFKQLLENLE